MIIAKLSALVAIAAMAAVSTEVVPSAMNLQQIPGAVVAVVREGHVILEQGYGLRNISGREPVDPNTIFEIGSITKQFTAAAVLQLKERGKLRLTDRLGRYVPEYSRGKDVTIEQLLYQTSGIPDHINNVPNAVKIISGSPGNLDAALALVKEMPLHFKPGTQWEYSNTNYLLLGAIVSRVSHMPFHEYVSRNIFARAHMTRSAFLKDEFSLPNVARGYELAPTAALTGAGHIGYGWSGGAGSIISTAGDIARWDDAFFGDRIISAADVRLATTPSRINGRSTAYGFGWDVDKLDGLPMISHDGGMLGFTATNEVFPTLGIRIIVLANNGNASPDAIAKGILASLNPDFAKKRNAAASGEDRLVTARIAKVWGQLHEGEVDRSLLTESFSHMLTPRVLRFMHAHFARLLHVGPPVRWIYKGSQLGDDGTTYTYRVLFKGDAALSVSATIAKDGDVAACDTDYD